MTAEPGSDWWLEVSPPADDPRWRPHHIRPGERVEIRDVRTGQIRIDHVATANPRFLTFPDGLAFEQPQIVDNDNGSFDLRPGVPVLSPGKARFILKRASS